MKQIYITLISLFFSFTFFAQGIAVQGIARDNNNSSISDENMTFTFSIVQEDNTVIYKETETIRTDNFGVFSHIVSTGSPLDGTSFSEIDFSMQGLKIKVSVNYKSNNIEVYNQIFQYTPYAHYAVNSTNAVNATNAANGVPVGTVVAFMGDDDKIPTGWVKCTGQNISSGSQYVALRAVIGNTIPDLRARFLRGQGRSSNIDTRTYDETTAVRQYLNQTISWHNHSIGLNTDSAGNHSHTTSLKTDNISTDGGGTRAYAYDIDGNNAYPTRTPSTSTTGNHTHSVNGNTGNINSLQNAGATVASRGEENRPWTVVVNYIIKL